ncbi:hypothetical protein LZ30DRAFT_170848 [Colletotrichum cereale]|nr:hypothetical protein LZ30DRAFT_170848 [Colletotrichum cereale]
MEEGRVVWGSDRSIGALPGTASRPPITVPRFASTWEYRSWGKSLVAARRVGRPSSRAESAPGMRQDGATMRVYETYGKYEEGDVVTVPGSCQKRLGRLGLFMERKYTGGWKRNAKTRPGSVAWVSRWEYGTPAREACVECRQRMERVTPPYPYQRPCFVARPCLFPVQGAAALQRGNSGRESSHHDRQPSPKPICEDRGIRRPGRL